MASGKNTANRDSTISSAKVIDPKSVEIGKLLDMHPGGFGLEVDEYDAVLRGEGLFFFQEWVDKGEYLDHFLITANWWLKVGRLVADAIYTKCDSKSAEEFYADIGRVFALFGPAWRAFDFVDAVGSDPTGVEMIRRYCVVREKVFEHVARYLPDADIQRLRAAL